MRELIQLAQVTVTIPSLLAQMIAGQRIFDVQGTTIIHALTQLAREHPELGVHIFDAAGSVRRLVLCAHNGVILDKNQSLQQSLQDGDEIQLIASIAGG